jgi:hypothetical protein
MSDMFGGILDSIRNIGDNVEDFFGSSSSLLGGLGSAYLAGAKSPQVRQRSVGQVEIGNKYAPADLTQETDYKESEDFSRIEAEWMQRLERFSGLTKMAKDTEVSLKG